MTSAILLAADLTPARFEQLLAAIRATGTPRIWLSAPDGWCLDYWAGLSELIAWRAAGQACVSRNAADVVQRSVEGRLFDPTGELRWRVIPSLGEATHRVVFLGESPWWDGDWLQDEQAALQGLDATTESFFLWGGQTRKTQEANEWIELKIPHRFQYPLPLPERSAHQVKLLADVWRDERGEPHFLRFRELKGDLLDAAG